MRAILLAALLAAASGCTPKPVIPVPSERIDIAIHCGPENKDADGCVVEDSDAIRVYVLTRRAMCESSR